MEGNEFGAHHVDSKGETTKKYSADPCQPDNIKELLSSLDSWSFETGKFLKDGKNEHKNDNPAPELRKRMGNRNSSTAFVSSSRYT